MWDSFPDAMGAALTRHDEIVRSAIDANWGRSGSAEARGHSPLLGRAALSTTIDTSDHL